MLKLDLPPVPSYGARSTLILSKGRLELTDMELYISDSKLHGRLAAMASDDRPKVVIDLRSPLIQINNFIFPGWSPRTNTADTNRRSKNIDEIKETTGPQFDTTTTQSIAKLMAPESLKTDSKESVDDGYPIHDILLGNDILIVENLCNLDAVKQRMGFYSFLPLKLKGSDGSPIRAVFYGE